MLRINLILFVVLICMSLGVVTAQHQSRKLFFELEQQETLNKQYKTEYDQLQIEQSTWAMHSRLEDFAITRLQMHAPGMKQVQVVTLPASVNVQGGH